MSVSWFVSRDCIGLSACYFPTCRGLRTHFVGFRVLWLSIHIAIR